MEIYAHIYVGTVWEIIQPMTDGKGNSIPLAERYTAAFCAQCVDVTNVTPAPQQGWIATETNGAWTFSPPEEIAA